MLDYGAMKIDKFFQRKGYNNLRYKWVRCKVNKFLMQDTGWDGRSSRHAHNVKNLVRFKDPEQLTNEYKVSDN